MFNIRALFLVLALTFISCMSVQARPALATTGVQRGINLFGGWQGGSSSTFASDSQLAYFQSKGLNEFRVGFSWPQLQPTLYGSLDPTYLGMMDTLVSHAAARGQLVAFVPLPGNYNGSQVGSAAVPVSAFTDVWTKLATHYVSSAGIWGYDLLNEPAMGDSWNTSIGPQTITAIRAVDSVHTIFMPTSTGGYGYFWNSHTVGLPMNDPANNIVYEAHFYMDWPPNGNYSKCVGAPSTCFSSYKSAAVKAGYITSTFDYKQIGVKEATDFVNWCNTNAQKCDAGEYGIPGGWTSGSTSCIQATLNQDSRWETTLGNFLTSLDQHGINGTYWEGGPYGDINSAGPTCSGIDMPQIATLMLHE